MTDHDHDSSAATLSTTRTMVTTPPPAIVYSVTVSDISTDESEPEPKPPVLLPLTLVPSAGFPKDPNSTTNSRPSSKKKLPQDSKRPLQPSVSRPSKRRKSTPVPKLKPKKQRDWSKLYNDEGQLYNTAVFRPKGDPILLYSEFDPQVNTVVEVFTYPRSKSVFKYVGTTKWFKSRKVWDENPSGLFSQKHGWYLCRPFYQDLWTEQRRLGIYNQPVPSYPEDFGMEFESTVNNV
jgi:hypothetical protein